MGQKRGGQDRREEGRRGEERVRGGEGRICQEWRGERRGGEDMIGQDRRVERRGEEKRGHGRAG